MVRAQTVPVRGLAPDLSVHRTAQKCRTGVAAVSSGCPERLRWIINKPRRRRRKALVTAIWTMLALLSVGMTMQWLRADREARRAEQEAVRAEREATGARECRTFSSACSRCLIRAKPWVRPLPPERYSNAAQPG